MTDRPRTPAWAVVGLVLALAFATAWRWHTMGPSALSRPFEGWLVRSGETEPLDCDEALYAFMGKRILRGDFLYRDLVENKPPLGYGLYTLAVAAGGANETTVRVMPIPYVLGTLALVWWLALRMGGPLAAVFAGFAFAVADADPYVFGNGANMEHFVNLFSVASLALMAGTLARVDRRGWGLVGVGFLVGLATLVKQPSASHGLVFAGFVALDRTRPIRGRCVDLARLAGGFMAACVLILGGLLLYQGAGASAYECIITFAEATRSDIAPAANAPPFLVRLVAGNADPQGALPWPFGKTTYYAWWGAGLWPLWLAGVVATGRLILGRGGEGSGSASLRRLVGWFAISCWVQVALPGQFWQHYYLLAVPGTVLAASVWLADGLGGLRAGPGRIVRGMIVAALIAAAGWPLHIQARDYLGRTPEEITTAIKGGGQWVELRRFGREIAQRTRTWREPRLFLWGWQSPLYLYGNLAPASRHLFVNDLLRDRAGTDHPLIGRWTEEILDDLKADPPELIFAGYPPFPALRSILESRYVPSGLASPYGRALRIEPGRLGAFERAIVTPPR